MTTLLLVQSLVFVVLILISGFFSSAEVAYFSLNPIQLHRLSQVHASAAERIRLILHTPTRLLSTILIGNTVVNVGVSVLGFAIAETLVPGYGEEVAIVGMTFILLVLGEVAPKRVALLWPEKLATWYAPPITAIMAVLTPVRIGLEKITETFAHGFRVRGRTLTEEEFETVVELSQEKGVLDRDERVMVKGIIRLEDRRARDVMMPRVDIQGVDLNNREQDLETLALRSKVRQLVLYRDTIDRVEGFLDVRQYLLDPHHRVQAAWIPPLFIPESCPLDKLLSQLLRERRRAAIVVDEYGGTAGLVTRGDILEEITGEIDDEHAEHKLLFESTGPNRWIVDGQVSLEDINEALGLKLEAEGADRIAGWIAAQAERLPRPEDVVVAQGCRAVVQQMRKNRITLVRLEKIEVDEEEQES